MPRRLPLTLRSEERGTRGETGESPPAILGTRGLLACALATVVALSVFAGCRARLSGVSPDLVDKAPPYSFPDLTSPLESVVFAADGYHGFAAGSFGAILRTDDGGLTWQRAEGVSVKLEIHSVAISPDGSRGFAVGDSGIVGRSVDGGRTWAIVAAIPVNVVLHSVTFSADGRDGWIVGGNSIVLRSVDEGKTWQKSDTPGIDDLQSVTFAPDARHGWAAGDSGTLLYTGDGGVTWKRALGIASSEYLQCVTFSADGLHGWTVGQNGVIYVSANGGLNWRKIADTPDVDYLNSVTFAADGLRGWAVGDFGTVLRSADGGKTWLPVSRIPTTEDLYSVAFGGDGQWGVAVGDSGVILRTGDGGQTWVRAAGPLTDQILHSITFAPDARHGCAVGNRGSIVISSDGGQTWQKSPGVPTTSALESVAFAADGIRGWAVGDLGTALHTSDGGQHWQKAASVPTTSDLESVAFAADGKRGWAVGSAGTILSTTDAGQNWQKHPGVVTAAELDGVTFTPDGSRGWAVGAGGTILRTSNSGQSWQAVPGIITQRTLRSVSFAPGGTLGWTTGDFGTLLRTTDGGQNWETLLSDVSTLTLSSIAFASDGARGWMVGGAGNIMRSADGGGYWWYIAQDARQGNINSVAVSADGEHAWAAGLRGAIFRTSSSTGDLKPFEGNVTVHLESGPSTIHPVVSVEGRTSPGVLYVHLGLSGPRAIGDTAKGFQRYFILGQPYAGWKTDDLGAGVYTCHVEVFDGWNIVSQDFQFGNGPWVGFVGFMGWDIAVSQPLEFAKAHGTQNLVLLLILYCVAIAGLFTFRPSLFVLWHEKAAPLIAALPIPGKATDKVTQLAGLFLIGRARALDAVVRQFAPVALAELEKLPEAAARPIWVAAPLQIEDELFGRTNSPFAVSTGVPSGELYIRGLTELKRHLVNRRWWLSIEGPGGVGKSALAFQLARWFAAPEPQSRLGLAQAVPIYVRSLKDGLDKEVLAELKRILGLPRMSAQLSEALLSQRRVLALIDGISEKATDIEALELGPLNPAKGGELTHLVVMTSRRRIQISEVVKVLPSPVDLGTIDEVLSRYLDDVVGAGRFTPSQREAIRDSLKGIMKEMAHESGQAPQIPMVFVKLIIQRADEVLAKDDTSGTQDSAEAALPKDLAELVDAYIASLLEARPDGAAEASQARRAALACIGQDGIPKLRPLAAYELKSLTAVQLEGLVTAGLMVKDAADVGDPRYKFALDPIAEYLAAKELVIAVRDGRMTLAQLKGDCSQFIAGSDVPAKMIQIGRALGVTVS